MTSIADTMMDSIDQMNEGLAVVLREQKALEAASGQLEASVAHVVVRSPSM